MTKKNKTFGAKLYSMFLTSIGISLNYNCKEPFEIMITEEKHPWSLAIFFDEWIYFTFFSKIFNLTKTSLSLY